MSCTQYVFKLITIFICIKKSKIIKIETLIGGTKNMGHTSDLSRKHLLPINDNPVYQ